MAMRQRFGREASHPVRFFDESTQYAGSALRGLINQDRPPLSFSNAFRLEL